MDFVDFIKDRWQDAAFTSSYVRKQSRKDFVNDWKAEAFVTILREIHHTNVFQAIAASEVAKKSEPTLRAWILFYAERIRVFAFFLEMWRISFGYYDSEEDMGCY